MSLSSILNSLSSSSPHTRTRRRPSPRQRTAARRLALEALEDRCLLSFLATVNYDASPSPNGESLAVASADFNGDAQLDLAVTNYFSNSVSVLLGNADGTFQPPLTSAAGAYPKSLSVGDFNADGKLDLIIDSSYGLGQSLLLGNGNGTFQAPSSIGVGVVLYPESVAVGDFNGDGKLDLGGTTNYWGYGYFISYSRVLLGNGDGSFSGPRSTFIGYYGPHDPEAVVDVNGDGMSDLVLAVGSGSVGVLPGDGLGNLQPLTYLATGVGPTSSVVAGDVNGDGNIDLVTSNLANSYYGFNSSVSVLLGDGLGSFGSAQIYATGDGPKSVVLGDFNRDGQVDLMTVNAANVSVLLGRGGGTYTPPLNFTAFSYPYDTPDTVVAGDFNRDGWLDAATTNSGTTVSVLINDQSWPPANLPLVTINDVNVTEGNTGTVNATFTVSLSAAYGQPVTVNFTTADESMATAGSDYQATSGTLTFAPGETSQTVTVQVNGDRLAEGYESFSVNLSNPTNALVADATGVGVILDDEPYVAIVDYVNGVEGNTGTTPFTFTVTLSPAYDAPVTVSFATANNSATAGSDYQAASGTVTFAPGVTSQTITVLVYGDRLGEAGYFGGGYENFFVKLTGAVGAHISYVQSQATIQDDEPRISISDVTKAEGKKGQTTLFTFTVTLSAAYDQAVTISFRTANSTAKTSDGDYISKTGTLTFAPGETTKTITIQVKGDSKNEANETFYLDLFGNSSNSLFTKNRGIGTILNDD